MFSDIRAYVSQQQVQTRLQTIGTWIAVLYAGWSLWTTRKIAKDNQEFLERQQRFEYFQMEFLHSRLKQDWYLNYLMRQTDIEKRKPIRAKLKSAHIYHDKLNEIFKTEFPNKLWVGYEEFTYEYLIENKLLEPEDKPSKTDKI